MDFAVVFLVISLAFLSLVGFYFSRSRSDLDEERKIALEEEKIHQEAMRRDEERIKEELRDVHEKANMILAEAQKIAQELIDELESVLGKRGKEVNVPLPQGSNYEIELGSLSDRLKNNYVNRIKHLLASVEKFEYQKAKEVEKFADEQMATTDKSLQKVRAEELKKINARIERYKEEELSLFDKKVREIVEEAAKEVLGHQLTNQEHGELIQKVLERAKEEQKI